MTALHAQLPALQVVVPLLGAVAAGLLRRGGLAFALALAVTWVAAAISWALLVQVLAGGPPGGQPYDAVFADPPYAAAESEIEAVLQTLLSAGWLAPDAVLIVERSTRSPALTWVPGITPERCREYGETTLWYGRHS